MCLEESNQMMLSIWGPLKKFIVLNVEKGWLGRNEYRMGGDSYIQVVEAYNE